MTIIEYVAEEVTRQGHDVHQVDGLQRVAWMLDAWWRSMDESKERPGVGVAIKLGSIIEPYKNAEGLRTCGVRVGNRICPDFRDVPRLLDALFEQRDALSPVEFYKEFELIHPFVDGNGRTGKVILNWLNGTLGNPIFPPADLFGYPIGNP